MKMTVSLYFKTFKVFYLENAFEFDKENCKVVFQIK